MSGIATTNVWEVAACVVVTLKKYRNKPELHFLVNILNIETLRNPFSVQSGITSSGVCCWSARVSSTSLLVLPSPPSPSVFFLSHSFLLQFFSVLSSPFLRFTLVGPTSAAYRKIILHHSGPDRNSHSVSPRISLCVCACAGSVLGRSRISRDLSLADSVPD